MAGWVLGCPAPKGERFVSVRATTGSDLVGPAPEGLFQRFRLLLSGIVTQGIHDTLSPLGTDD